MVAGYYDGAGIVSVISTATAVFKVYRNLSEHRDSRFAAKKDLDAHQSEVAKLREAAHDRVEVGSFYRLIKTRITL